MLKGREVWDVICDSGTGKIRVHSTTDEEHTKIRHASKFWLYYSAPYIKMINDDGSKV